MTTQEAPNPETKAKPPTSQAKIESNRRNSLLSTGPRTEQGKLVSRLNGVTHGCASKTPVLPGEDPEVRRNRLDAWWRDLGAVTEPERQLVETAVDASCCMDRARLAEVAALTRQVHQVDEAFEDALAADVEELTGRLLDEPAVVRQLRKSSLGCRWLLGQWEAIALRLEEFRWIEVSQRRLTTALLGKRPTDLFTDPTLMAWVAAYLSTIVGNADFTPGQVKHLLQENFPEGMPADEVERRVATVAAGVTSGREGRMAMQAIVAGVIDDLTERLELVEAREDRDHALAIDAARFDASAEGARRLRYQMAHERVLRASLRELRALQAARPEQSSAPAPTLLPMTTVEAPEVVAPSEAKSIAPSEPKSIAPSEPKLDAPSEPKLDAPSEPNAAERRTQPGDSSIRSDDPAPRAEGTRAGTPRLGPEMGTEPATCRGDRDVSQDQAA